MYTRVFNNCCCFYNSYPDSFSFVLGMWIGTSNSFEKLMFSNLLFLLDTLECLQPVWASYCVTCRHLPGTFLPSLYQTQQESFCCFSIIFNYPTNNPTTGSWYTHLLSPSYKPYFCVCRLKCLLLLNKNRSDQKGQGGLTNCFPKNPEPNHFKNSLKIMHGLLTGVCKVFSTQTFTKVGKEVWPFMVFIPFLSLCFPLIY